MNTMVNYYDMIFKRKSFHLFKGVGNESITEEELNEIRNAYQSFNSLYPDIKTEIRIVPAKKISLRLNAEYWILIYSEKKDNYLMNAGYIGEQLDLWLVQNHIGTLWNGIAKPDEPVYRGLDYVIMFAVRKVKDDTKYRKDMFKAKRKPLEEIWQGDELGIADITRFAPSACNSQPWTVTNNEGKLTVHRYKKPGKRGIMPLAAVPYFNRIDMGIYLCFLEICLQKQHIGYERELFVDAGGDEELTKVAEYRL